MGSSDSNSSNNQYEKLLPDDDNWPLAQLPDPLPDDEEDIAADPRDQTLQTIIEEDTNADVTTNNMITDRNKESPDLDYSITIQQNRDSLTQVEQFRESEKSIGENFRVTSD